MQFEVGETYLRTCPVLGVRGTWEYDFCSTPIQIVSVEGNRVVYRFTTDSLKGRILREGPRTLPPVFLDNNWEKLSNILMGDDWCALDHFSGHTLYRKQPLETTVPSDDPCFGFSFDVLEIRKTYVDNRFVGKRNACRLIAATNHNVVVENETGRFYLDERFAKPEDWVILT